MNSPMRILILTPSMFPSVTGNAITTERWRRSLRAKGLPVEVLSSEGLDPSAFLDHLHSFQPDLIHVHHAFKTGALILDPRVASAIALLPLVVSPGGTDINLDLAIPGRMETTLEVLRMARIIVAQNLETTRSLREKIPESSNRIVLVPKACSWFGSEPYDLRAVARCGPERVLFFLPAGIRPVKGNLECLLGMRSLQKIRPQVLFIAAGPSVDAEYAARFEREVNKLSSFAHWIRMIPPNAMQSAYRTSDIVLNASFSEGLSNSLLEASAAGRPILASDIPGNRQPVLGNKGDRPAGLLFDPHNTDDFVEKAIQLVDNSSLREKLGEAALLQTGRIPDPEEEANGLIAAYQAALNLDSEVEPFRQAPENADGR